MRSLPALVSLPVVVVAALPSGCSYPFPVYRELPAIEAGPVPVPPPRLTARPVPGRLTARAVLTVGGMELPMTLRILQRPPTSLRVVGLDDLGGTVFHLLLHDDERHILRQAPQLPEALLRDGILPDLAAWLLLDTHEARYLPTTEFGWVLAQPDLLVRPGAGIGGADRIDIGAAGRLRTSLELRWAEGAPAGARIEGHAGGGYRLAVEVSDWQPGELGEEQFRIQAETGSGAGAGAESAEATGTAPRR